VTIILVITITTAIAIYILEICTLFTRNRIVDPRSIYKRNRTKRRLVLSLKTCISLRNLAISTSNLARPTYNILLISKARIA